MLRLFQRLSYLWVGVNLAAALVSLALLSTVPTPVFVGTATPAAWLITCTGVVLRVFGRTALSQGAGHRSRSERLVACRCRRLDQPPRPRQRQLSSDVAGRGVV
jgi:hypothetical protein